jgi:hypothetical protein
VWSSKVVADVALIALNAARGPAAKRLRDRHEDRHEHDNHSHGGDDDQSGREPLSRRAP